MFILSVMLETEPADVERLGVIVVVSLHPQGRPADPTWTSDDSTVAQSVSEGRPCLVLLRVAFTSPLLVLKRLRSTPRCFVSLALVASDGGALLL